MLIYCIVLPNTSNSVVKQVLFAVVLMACAPLAFATDLTTNIVAVWHLNDSALPQTDSIAGYNMTNHYADYTTDGKISGAYSFDSTNDSYMISDIPPQFRINHSLTLKAWVNVSAFYTDYYVVDMTQFPVGGGGTYGGFSLQLRASGEIAAIIWDVTAVCIIITGNQTVSTGTFDMITMVFDDDADTLETFLNGQSTEKISCTDNPLYFDGSQEPILLGAGTGNYSLYYGVIDEVALWDRALSADEIMSVYTNETASVPYPYGLCTPNWVCDGYDSCNISNLAPCNSVTDLNSCGGAYGGDYSEFSPQSCNYCVADVTLYNTTGCVLNLTTNCYIDNNFSTCCAVTGLPSDCPQNASIVCSSTGCCSPNWVCDGYGSCNISDLAPCDSVTDTYICSENYSGDYSEFSPQPCNYCAASVALYNTTGCIVNTSTTCTNDSNYASCCAVTGLPSDCPQNASIVCTSEGCSLSVFEYDSNDITGAAIDGMVKFVIGIASVAFLVTFLYVGLFAYNRFKMK